jgi:hypothetical protein
MISEVCDCGHSFYYHREGFCMECNQDCEQRHLQPQTL